jgi:murein L,D-transpeptidase YafK
MTDERIEEIYALGEAALAKGQPFFRVHVFPFRITSENLDPHKGSEWYDFWLNLKDGFEFFERTGRPPSVEVKNRLYVFGPS